MGKSKRIRSRRRVPHADKCESGAATNLPRYLAVESVGNGNCISFAVGSRRAILILHTWACCANNYATCYPFSFSRKQGETPFSHIITPRRPGSEKSDPDAWPLLTDDQGFITESTGANFFIVKRDRLLTPEPRNCLRGISRNFVLQLARKFGVEYRERNIEAYDAITADEAFFTCTPSCVVPCTSINGQKIGNGKVGKVTKFLMDKWKEEVDCDFVEQAVGWDEKNLAS
jgi:hypothetical protein